MTAGPAEAPRPVAYLLADGQAVPVDVVTEVVPLPKVTPLPGAGPGIAGLAWVRDRIRLVLVPATGSGAEPSLLLVTEGDLACVAGARPLDLVDATAIPRDVRPLRREDLAAAGIGPAGGRTREAGSRTTDPEGALRTGPLSQPSGDAAQAASASDP